MDLPPVRKFLLASYYDLPNILFVGSLILGSLTGYLPLVWMAFGLVFNWLGTTALQLFFKLIHDSFTWPSWLGANTQIIQNLLKQFKVQNTQMNRFGYTGDLLEQGKPMGASIPSHWMSATAFFAVFILHNSVKVMNAGSAKGAEKDKVESRRAFSLSALIVGLVFFGLILLRVFTGYESMLGGGFGILFGGVFAVSFWALLNACGAGMVPDILQVMGSLAPDRKGSDTPVMCVAPDTAAEA